MYNSVFANLRKNKKISQQSLAERLFVSIATVRKWEKGESIPPLEDMKKIADIFEVDVLDILTIFTPQKTKVEESDDKEEEVYYIIQDSFWKSDNTDDFIFFAYILSMFHISGLVYYENFAFHFNKVISEIAGTAIILSDNDKNQIILTIKNILSVNPISNNYDVFTFDIVVCCPIFPTSLKYLPKTFKQKIRISFFNT